MLFFYYQTSKSPLLCKSKWFPFYIEKNICFTKQLLKITKSSLFVVRDNRVIYNIGKYVLAIKYTILTMNKLQYYTYQLYYQVYKDTGSTLVHSGQGYTGSSVPPTVEAMEGTVTVVMKTSGTGADQGFRAIYDAGKLYQQTVWI